MPDELAIMIALSPEPTGFLQELLAYCVRRASEVGGGVFLPQLLERIAIERPDFRASGQLGWALLGICHLILLDSGTKMQSSVRMEQLVAIMRHLGSDSRIAFGIASALGQSFRKHPSPGVAILSLRPGVRTTGEEGVLQIFQGGAAELGLPEIFISEMERAFGHSADQ